MPKKSKMADRYDSILLEGLRSDFRVVAESVGALQDKVQSLEHRINGMDESFHLQLLEVKHSMHGRMLETKQDLRAYLVEAKQEIMTQVSGKTDQFESRLSRCERDIDQLKATHS
jgi:hypothetical protein